MTSQNLAPIPAAQTTRVGRWALNLKFHLDRQTQLRSTLVARHAARALLGSQDSEDDIWLVAALLGACPLTRAPLSFVVETLDDFKATEMILAQCRHTAAWALTTQDNLPLRCQRVRQHLQNVLARPLPLDETALLEQLFPMSAPLADHVVPTREVRAVLKRVIHRGFVLKDGVNMVWLDAARRCARKQA